MRVDERFGVLKRSFWVKDIAENVLEYHKTINEQREKSFMQNIRERTIEKEV